jgi:hypothetical protein
MSDRRQIKVHACSGDWQSMRGHMISEKASGRCEGHHVWYSKDHTLFLCMALPVILIMKVSIGWNLEFEMFCFCESLGSTIFECQSRLSRCEANRFHESMLIEMNISESVEILRDSRISWSTSSVSQIHWMDMDGRRVNSWVLEIICLFDSKKNPGDLHFRRLIIAHPSRMNSALLKTFGKEPSPSLNRSRRSVVSIICHLYIWMLKS